MANPAQLLIHRLSSRGIVLAIAVCLSGCGSFQGPASQQPPEENYSLGAGAEVIPPPEDREERPTFTQVGTASWYRETRRFKRTANGEKLEPMQFTAAHRSLPFGTVVRVTSILTAQSVLVRINDRGPFIRGRIIDVSLAAAMQLGMVDGGLSAVRIAVYESDQCGTNAASAICSSGPTSARQLRPAQKKSATLP
jgi:rare lipoprotein A (peptidoglycan hydrolase)